MKSKIFATCVIVFFSGILSVASAQKPILKAGLNLANVSITDDGDVDDAKTLTSFHAGISGDFRLGGPIYIQPGLMFTGKGTKTELGDDSDATYYRATSNPYYIEVPVNLVLKAPMGTNAKFFVGAGPYLGIGIAGNNEVRGRYLGVEFSSESDIEFSDDDPSTLEFEEGAGFGIMKRFDYGVNGTAGIEGSSMLISLNYGHGLAKLQSGSGSGDDNNNKHRVWGVSVGFKL